MQHEGSYASPLKPITYPEPARMATKFPTIRLHISILLVHICQESYIMFLYKLTVRIPCFPRPFAHFSYTQM